MFHVVFHHPEIPGNTGNAIRMVAGAGCVLHLIEPLGFSVEDAQLRRAGLDYHDKAVLHVHPDIEAAWRSLEPQRVIAFTASAQHSYETIAYRPGDVLLFGRESTGLPDEVLRSEQLTQQVHIPMLPGIRSMNLANSAAVAVYEAWRQQGFTMP
ncbi:tRNA (cytidine/uridine-2'-O-)-methyltransferase [Halopolyspora algeriensis]|uniref:Putative tRNA (cytidine(34)-2'-O)-methyltransferase n=1 Tax=Halopolyspora algeriensis TaxID=1500506 RepID=A0A368VGW5_9ACTN|nr:tRNA (cytidine(34)-2'-O)-methyltransferase [Halopolyspora algeriensis]RCW40353.1 tRNA (cytidine/uridine-2'-O-)-methyltransferase [Halopolyspora algeriensis]TQM53638.1 tRNA (cytidine/uridine-2'-O-)-methyltransferase [Halopolyspora algeriensis]